MACQARIQTYEYMGNWKTETCFQQAVGRLLVHRVMTLHAFICWKRKKKNSACLVWKRKLTTTLSQKLVAIWRGCHLPNFHFFPMFVSNVLRDATMFVSNCRCHGWLHMSPYILQTLSPAETPGVNRKSNVIYVYFRFFWNQTLQVQYISLYLGSNFAKAENGIMSELYPHRSLSMQIWECKLGSILW